MHIVYTFYYHALLKCKAGPSRFAQSTILVISMSNPIQYCFLLRIRPNDVESFGIVLQAVLTSARAPIPMLISPKSAE